MTTPLTEHLAQELYHNDDTIANEEREAGCSRYIKQSRTKRFNEAIREMENENDR